MLELVWRYHQKSEGAMVNEGGLEWDRKPPLF